MRTFIGGGVMVVLAATMVGCASDAHKESSAKTEAQAEKMVASKACVMQAGGQDVLRLTVPSDTKVTSKNGELNLIWHDRYVEMWLVSGANTVEEGVGRVTAEIKDEFMEFKATSATDMKVAGKGAKRLMGTGKEADDNDPGTADVIVFKVGDRVFVACTHGESLSPIAQEWMAKVVQSVKAP